MKEKLYVSLVIFIGVLFYFFAGSSMYETGSSKKVVNVHPSTAPSGKFLIGAMNTGYDPSLSHMSDIGFNLWHKYTGYDNSTISGRQTPWMSPNDNLTANISSYSAEVNAQLTEAVSNGLDMSAIMTRPKLEWLCYGQRSTYQCEPISKADDNEWFYAFRDRAVGDTIRDDGALVVRCLVNQNQTDGGANWIVKGLKSNTEQCNPGQFKGDSLSTWFIKPRIKIDSATAVNFPNRKVCKVVVIGQSGDTLKM